ncbi:uncharacterized protein LOC116349802 [Contarinia nasturtii]|uniref:uncharacterized protein LOC116349802 n=1 Tax=Contarinia nasturtii TaxID=265458 RepID=UPI0012D386EE|nr:uncharacterized protein LOC116349802 [Contarinia nasturtii]
MVTTQRYEHIAKLAGDFVLGVREKCVNSNRRFCLRHLSQVDVSGFGVGAHIAGRTCQYLQQTLRQRPRILLALDPIKTPLLGTTIKDTIKRGDADYVQVIHTSQEVGIWDQLGDVDIYVRSDSQSHSDPLNDEHGIAFFIHLATSTKRLYLTASSNENGIGTVSIMPPMTKAIECLIGVYGFPKWNDIGKRFGFSLDNRSSLFWREMTHFAWTDIHLNSQLGAGVRPFGRTKLFSGTQPEVRVNESSDSDDDECTICCKNKINARLSCNHEMCHTCWIRWNYTPESQNKCPMCKQTVTSVDKFS